MRSLTLWLAAIPLTLAAVGDPLQTVGVSLRERLLAASLGVDHSGAAPTALILALADLLPLGPRELRMSLGAALPATLVVWMLLDRMRGQDAAVAERQRQRVGGPSGPQPADALSGDGRWWPKGTGLLAHQVLVLVSAGLWASVLLDGLGPISWIPLAMELAARVRRVSKSGSRGWVSMGACFAWASWVMPLALPSLAMAVAGGSPASWRRDLMARGGRRPERSAFVVGAIALAGLVLCGWLARQHAPGGIGAWWTTVTTATPLAESLRIEVWLPWLLALSACALRPRVVAHRSALEGCWPAFALLVTSLLCRDGRLLVAASALMVPFATLGLMSVVNGLVTSVRRPGWRPRFAWALVWLAPALVAGRAANVVESRVRASMARLPLDAELATALVTVGLYPPRSLVLVDDELGLLAVAHAQALFGLRPDVSLLPLQDLLGTAAVERTAHVALVHPAALPVVQGLLARGQIQAPDLSTLAQQVPTVVDVDESALQPLVFQVDPMIGALRLTPERVSPSDRRASRVSLGIRARELADVVQVLPRNDSLRAWLRRTAHRETRALAAVNDREALLTAIEKAEALAADGRPDPMRASLPMARPRVAQAR